MQLTQDEDEIFKWAYGLVNTGGDNSIEARELEAFMSAIGRKVPDSDIHAMINEGDLDGNGDLEYMEFVAIVSQRMRGNLDDDELRDAFRLFDKENDGYITIENIRKVVFDADSMPIEEDIEEAITLYDNDGDGKLSYEEFVLAMTKK